MDFNDKIRHRILYSHVLRDENGEQLLDYMTRRFSRFDRDGWRGQILAGTVQLNDHETLPDTVLKTHDCIAYFPGEPPEPPARKDYRIAYEDQDLLVIDKPGDLCVHPTGPFYRNTLWNLVGQKYGEVRFVQRLDRETSGLLIAARNAATATALEQNQHCIRKEYLVLVEGDVPAPFRARGYLVPDTSSCVPKKKTFIPDSAPDEKNPCFADSEFAPVQHVFPDMTLVQARLHTGRQHQIRATLCSLGYPVVGDKLYGADERIFLKIPTQSFTADDMKRLRLPRQALHSSRLAFTHPVTGAPMEWESPFPWNELLPANARLD